MVLEDLGSLNGTFVNKKRIEKQVLQSGDRIEIGDFILVWEEEREDVPSDIPEKDAKKASAEPKEKKSSKATDEFMEIKRRLHKVLIDRMDLKRMIKREVGDEELRKQTVKKVKELLASPDAKLPKSIDLELLEKELLDDILALGPLEDLLKDEKITEIMVNNANQIYIERSGKITLSSQKFLNDAQVLAVIQRIVAPLGRVINESSPLVDARLKDGSRVNAIIPPLAITGPSITIRKFSKRRLLPEDLIQFGSVTDPILKFMELCVEHRQNIVISGGTGSGKTTLLNIISSYIPHDERIVTVEDSAELNLPQEHVISLEARPPNIEGKGAVTIRDLVKNCLRMRPDRIVVGECRSGEALDMLQAMNTGHDGSLTTAHANSPRDALSRLETMVLMSGMELPLKAIRSQIASSVNVVIQQARLVDGSRKITHVTEVTGMEGDVITMQDIFLFQQTGYDDNGKVLGHFESTGNVPRFVGKLKERGIAVDMSMFDVN